MNIDHHRHQLQQNVVDALSDADSDNLQILFLDTFSSNSLEDRPFDDANKKDYSVGLIQFSEPVIIHELRIVPLSTLVTSDTLKGGRLGATIPSSFEVHFYVNDLKTKDASTFLDIGSFSYKEHERFIFKPQLHVPTDGLFLRGLFESLTIAVLGVVTDINRLVVTTAKPSKDRLDSHTNSYDEIKSIDEEEEGSGGGGRGHNSRGLDKSIEIKEPDDLDEDDVDDQDDDDPLDFVFQPRTTITTSTTSSTSHVPHTHPQPRTENASDNQPNNSCENHHHFTKDSAITKQQQPSDSVHPKPAEDVYSLSPSPVNSYTSGRIRSPSLSSSRGSSLALRSSSPPPKSRASAASSISAHSNSRASSASKDMRGDGGGRVPYQYQGKPSKYNSLSPSNHSDSPTAPYASSTVKGGRTTVDDSPPARYRTNDRDYHQSRDYHLHHHHHRDRHHLSPSVEREECHASSHHRDQDRDYYGEDKYHRGVEGELSHRSSSSHLKRSSPGEDRAAVLLNASHSRSSSSYNFSSREVQSGGRSGQQQLRSRSPSRESLYGRTAYLRSLDHHQPQSTTPTTTRSGGGGGGGGSSSNNSRRSLSRAGDDHHRSRSPYLSTSTRRGGDHPVSDRYDRSSVGSGGRGRDYHYADRATFSRSPIPSTLASKNYYASATTSSLYRSSSSRRSRSVSPVLSGGVKRRYRSPVPSPSYDHHHHQQQQHHYRNTSSAHREGSPFRHRRSRDSSLEVRHGRYGSSATGGVRSPEHKKSRYTLHRMNSPALSPTRSLHSHHSHHSYQHKSSSLRSISPSRRGGPRSPEGSRSRGVSKGSSSRLSNSSSSPSRRYHQHQTSSSKSAKHERLSSPYNNDLSRHSSLSNVSLRSLEQSNNVRSSSSSSSSSNSKRSLNGSTERPVNTTTTTITTSEWTEPLNGTAEAPVNGLDVKKIKTEAVDDDLFEPLSPSDDLLLLDEPLSPAPALQTSAASAAENYDKISISSEVCPMDTNTTGDAIASVYSETSTKPAFDKVGGEKSAALLEEISSDEEYDELDSLNTAAAALISSEKGGGGVEKSLEGSTENIKDEATDSTADFDLRQRFFDPFTLGQLKPLVFPLNSNSATNFIDEKLFAVIVGLVEEKFSVLYFSGGEEKRSDLINELWVKDVEQLASEIMKLSSPINVRGPPSLPKSTEVVATSDDHFEQLTSALIAITKDGLNFELANGQKQAFKVRHLKAGIKLFTSLFSSLDLRTSAGGLQLSTRLLQANLPHDLLLLYNRPYMTLSLRLLLLNGLIVLADHPDGVGYLCSQKLAWPDLDRSIFVRGENDENVADQQPAPKLTMYQYLLTLLLQPQKSRLTSVFEELLDKVHLFELFRALSQTSSASGDDQETLEAMLDQLLTAFHRLSNRIHRPLRLLPSISQYEIKTAVHASAPLLLISSGDGVKTSKTPDETEGGKAPEQLSTLFCSRTNCRHIACSSSKIGFLSAKAFYRYLTHFDLLGLLVRLLEQSEPQLNQKIVPLLDAFTSHQTGLKFLLEDQRNADYSNAIHRCLVSGGSDKSTTTAFGAKFATRLHTLNLVDGILQSIYESSQKEKEEDVEDGQEVDNQLQAIDHLYRLYTMVYLDRAVLRETVVGLLTSEHNFDAVMAFLLPVAGQFSSLKDSTQKATESANSTSFLDHSISVVYATRLAAACIQYLPESQLVHFYDAYGQLLLKSAETVQESLKEVEKDDSSSSSSAPKKSDIYQSHLVKYASLVSWLSPLRNGTKKIHFSHDELAIRLYVTLLKKAADAVRERMNATADSPTYRHLFASAFQPEVVTSVKVLAALCDPASDAQKNQAPEMQLKYRHSQLHCYSYDLVSYLLTLLEALVETCLRPSHLTFAAAGVEDSNFFLKSSEGTEKQLDSQEHQSSIVHSGGAAVLEFIRPSVRLLRLILRYLLKSVVGGSFADATPVSVLLKVYHYLGFYRRQQLLVAKNSSKSRLQEFEDQKGALEVQQEIVELLLSVYTAVYPEHPPVNEEALTRSVWTKMLKAVLAFTAASPAHFASGLELFGKILPPTFPTSSDLKITEIDSLHLVNYRKFWAAHLHVLKADLEQVVSLLLLSDSPLVRRRLRGVCRTLCSLHTPTVTGLARSLAEGFVQGLNKVLSLAWDQKVEDGGFRQAVAGCSRTFDIILHLFSASIPFRIALLSGLYLLVNSDAARKEPSKIYKLLGKLFKCLYSKRLEPNRLQMSSGRLIRNILAEEVDLESTANDHRSLSRLLVEYFEKNRSLIVVASEEGVFRFPEKLASRYISTTSEALNDYFGRHFATNLQSKSLASSGDEGGLPVTMIKEENKEGSSIIESGGPPAPQRSEDIVIYSAEFAALATLSGPLYSDEDEDEVQNKEEFRANFVALSQKYFGTSKDSSSTGSTGKENRSFSLSKTLEVLFSAIIEPPELQNVEKSTGGESGGGEHNHSNLMRGAHHHHHGGIMNHGGHHSGGHHSLSSSGGNNKRLLIRGGGRNHHNSRSFGGGNRHHHGHDPFRSRPPNTSRPPSMHVDDFVALEQRQDSTTSVKNARTSGGLSNSNKHQDYHMRKKNPPIHLASSYSSHHLSLHPLGGGARANSSSTSSTSGPSSAHYGKQ